MAGFPFITEIFSQAARFELHCLDARDDFTFSFNQQQPFVYVAFVSFMESDFAKMSNCLSAFHRCEAMSGLELRRKPN